MRSMLFVPGDRPERFAKAEQSGADAVILDLEDAVTPQRRPYARDAVADYLGSSARTVPLWVRINPVDSHDALPDLGRIAAARPDGIMLPKARDGADVQRLDHWLEALEAARGCETGSIRVIPLISEWAVALLRAASFAPTPARVFGMSWGAEDLAADLGAFSNKDNLGEFEPPYATARTLCLYTAAAAGVAAIDTVDTDIRDLAGVERRALASRCAGFTTKLLIHPAQVGPVHAAFTPSAQEVLWAERVIDVFRDADGKGAVALDGKLLDRPHVRLAERILATGKKP